MNRPLRPWQSFQQRWECGAPLTPAGPLEACSKSSDLPPSWQKTDLSLWASKAPQTWTTHWNGKQMIILQHQILISSPLTVGFIQGGSLNTEEESYVPQFAASKMLGFFKVTHLWFCDRRTGGWAGLKSDTWKLRNVNWNKGINKHAVKYTR